MLLGALLDLGAPLERVRAGVAAVAPEPVEITVERVHRAGFAALKAHVRVAESHHHRGWSHVRDLITAAGPELDDGARRRALQTFRLLAEAEARAHGVGLDEVHFHEVGALDAIADVVGVCVALEDLGVDEVHADVVAVGSGQVQTSHGLLPVPVPAVVELFTGTSAVLEAGPVRAELCTPTGAALLVAQVGAWGAPPPASVLRVGVGAGNADHPTSANVVRAVLVEPAQHRAQLLVRPGAVTR